MQNDRPWVNFRYNNDIIPGEALGTPKKLLRIPMSKPSEYYTVTMRNKTVAAYLNILSKRLPERNEKNKKTIRIVGVPAELRTGHLPNTNQKRFFN